MFEAGHAVICHPSGTQSRRGTDSGGSHRGHTRPGLSSGFLKNDANSTRFPSGAGVLGGPAEARIEPHGAPLASPLRLVHGGVRLLDESRNIRAVHGAERHSDRDGYRDGPTGKVEWGSNGVDGALGNDECIVVGGKLPEQPRDLVAAPGGRGFWGALGGPG